MPLLRVWGLLVGLGSIGYFAPATFFAWVGPLFAGPPLVAGILLCLGSATSRFARRRPFLFAMIWLIYSATFTGEVALGVLMDFHVRWLAWLLAFLVAGTLGLLRALYLATRQRRPGLGSYYSG